MELSWVLVIGFLCRFRSMRGVSANNDLGKGCGFLDDQLVESTDIRFPLSDKPFNFFSVPISSGKLTITLLSIFNSTRATRLDISVGIVARWFDERSNFSSFVRDAESMGRGTLDRKLPSTFSCFKPDGRFAGKASLLLGSSRLVSDPACLPNRFPPTDRLCNLDNLAIDTKDPDGSWFCSRFNDLRLTKRHIFGLSV